MAKATANQNVKGEELLIARYSKLLNKKSTGGVEDMAKKLSEQRLSGAFQLIKDFALKNKLSGPYEAFEKPNKERDQFLFDYVNKALEAGYSELDVAMTIKKYRYAHRIKNFQETTKDQSAGEIVLSANPFRWFDLIEGGKTIVENGKLLNGTFGRRFITLSEDDPNIVMTNKKADILYIIAHDQHAEMPLPPFVMFASVAEKTNDVKEAGKLVTKRRELFEKEMQGLVHEHHFKMPDAHHDSTNKFRLICTVFNKETGELLVVNRNNIYGERFVDWVDRNLNDILSASDKQIEKIGQFVDKIGLAKMLGNPKHSKDYQPWEYLKSKLDELDLGGKGKVSNYKKALKVWRYAMLEVQKKNVQEYEQRWEKIKKVQDITNAIIRISCNDGRSFDTDIKLLAAILSEDEFQRLVSEESGIVQAMKKMFFTPHYKCGMLTAAHKIHLGLGELNKLLMEEYEANKELNKAGEDINPGYEFRRSTKNLRECFKSIIEDDTTLPYLNVADYLPASVKEEFKEFARTNGETTAQLEHKGLCELLYDLFVNTDDTTRSSFRRAMEVGIMNYASVTEMPSMPSATTVYKMIADYLGPEQKELDFAKVNSLVVEEIARTTLEKMLSLAKKHNINAEVEGMIESYATGQYLKIPLRPHNKVTLLDFHREDFFLDKLYTKEERVELGLENMMAVDMPY
ncbi:MAG: hypothetical protein WC506_00645 [Candidatus Micrarchaeia archaeon]